MSTVVERAISAGFKLTAVGDQLRVRGPQRLLDHSPIMGEIRKHKSEIMDQLKDDLHQEWLFEIVKVGDDPWMIGTRLDKPGCWMFWFVRSEVSKQ